MYFSTLNVVMVGVLATVDSHPQVCTRIASVCIQPQKGGGANTGPQPNKYMI